MCRSTIAGITLLYFFCSTTLLAAPVPIFTGNAQNGITDLYSATFDGALVPCTGGSPTYCAFFGGDAPATRNIVITPSPTGVNGGVPVGIAPVPAAGSFLNIALTGGNSTAQIIGDSTISLPNLVLTIQGTTVVNVANAGFVIKPSGPAAINGLGQVEFLVNNAPGLAADFTTLTDAVTSCTGPLCALVPILSLDMVRYRLFIDYNATFTAFTASFQGQAGSNSLIYATLNSAGAPGITVTDEVAPVTDRQISFGSVTEQTTLLERLTVMNSGSSDLTLGTLGGSNALANPFFLTTDGCSGQVLIPLAACTVDVAFTPSSSGGFNDVFDIPSNAPDGIGLTVAVSGSGTAALIPGIRIRDSVPPAGDRSLPFGAVQTGASADQSFTVSNTGTTELNLGLITDLGQALFPFSLPADGCSGQTLTPLGSCLVTVRFAPTFTPGTYNNSLTVPSDDPDSPALIVALNGTAFVGDPTPEPFLFTDQVDVVEGTQITSNTVTVAGINFAVPISVVGGQYSIGCTGSFTGTAGTILNGQSVCVRHVSAIAQTTATNTTLTVGSYSDTFTSTTLTTFATRNDSATAISGQSKSIFVMANDVGYTNPVSVNVTSGPAHGTAVVTGSPGNQAALFVGYTATAGYQGQDSFTYQASDGVLSGSATVTIVVTVDADNDGVLDNVDNCLGITNADQRDTNGDGYGNICDADFNNNGIVDSQDGALLKAAFGSSAFPDRDLNGNGLVDSNDGARLKARFGLAPGPSGQHP